MNRIFLHICFAIFCVFSIGVENAGARALIADSHPRKINIDHNFKGVDILLYGAKNSYGNVVVVVKGPKKDFVLRQKGKVAGIWTNTKNIELKDFYSYYSIVSTQPLTKIQNEHLLKDLKIGVESLNYQIMQKMSEDHRNTSKDYSNAAIKLMQKNGLFIMDKDNEVSFWGGTLFRTFIEFPKNIVRGEYSIDLYLFNDGLLHSFQSMPIIVEQVGFEAFMYDLAHQKALLYGFLCVLIALVLGWATGYIFGKR